MSLTVDNFDENKIVDYILEKYMSDDDDYESYDDIFNDCFYSMFPTEEIRNDIYLKFYSDDYYDTLYEILYDKVEYAFDEIMASDDDTEESEDSDY
jgi:hypothetical protein